MNYNLLALMLDKGHLGKGTFYTPNMQGMSRGMLLLSVQPFFHPFVHPSVNL